MNSSVAAAAGIRNNGYQQNLTHPYSVFIKRRCSFATGVDGRLAELLDVLTFFLRFFAFFSAFLLIKFLFAERNTCTMLYLMSAL